MSDITNPWPHLQPVPMENTLPNPSNVRIIPTQEKTQPDFPPASSSALPVPRDDKGRFLTGNSGGGRKQGSRNKFTDTFMSAIAEDFLVNGSSALAALRSSNPEAYLRIIIALLPKTAVERWEQSRAIDYDNMTEEEFIELLNQLRREKFMQQAVETVSK